MNLPNRITLVRIILIPFMIFFYLASFIPGSWGKIVALGIFIIAALTDMLDGQIARKRNLVTNLGKFLDPIADKLLTMAALLLVVLSSCAKNFALATAYTKPRTELSKNP